MLCNISKSDFHKRTTQCKQPDFPTGSFMCQSLAWASAAQLNQWIKNSLVNKHSIYTSMGSLYVFFQLFQDIIYDTIFVDLIVVKCVYTSQFHLIVEGMIIEYSLLHYLRCVPKWRSRHVGDDAWQFNSALELLFQCRFPTLYTWPHGHPSRSPVSTHMAKKTCLQVEWLYNGLPMSMCERVYFCLGFSPLQIKAV